MANINTNKADKIMLYLRANGYARSGAEKLGPDIVNFLEDNGHTFVGAARNQIEKMSTSQWSNMQRDLWVAGHPQVENMFGLNPHEIEDLYMSKLGRINSNSHKIIPGDKTTGTPGIGGAKGGTGLIKPSYAFNGFDGTGWDRINLLQIAEDGTLDDDYVIKMKNLRTNPIGDEFEQVRTNLREGTMLGSYGVSPPAVSKAAPAVTTTTSPAVTEEEEEEDEEEVIAPAVIAYEYDADLLPQTITETIGVSPIPLPPAVDAGERKVSSKAYAELDITKTIPMIGGIIEVEMKTLSKTQGVSVDEITVEGHMEYDDFITEMTDAMPTGQVIEVTYTDEDGDEVEAQLLSAPKVKFLVNVDEGKVYIVINGQMLVASRGTEEYTFTDCSVKIHDPADKKEGISEIILDGSPMEFGKWIKKDGYFDAHFDYGFPVNGVEGLPAACYLDYYPDEEPDEVMHQPATLSAQARGVMLSEGGRPIVFGKPKSYTFDMDLLDEKYLQPLALNFDNTLNDDDAVIFVLNYGGKLNNKTNLFPGQIDDKVAGFTELQMFSYPNDIRNVRPINNENVVMLQKYQRRKTGEGIKDIMVDSTNLKDTLTYNIGGVDYMADVYTQVQITFDAYKAGKKEIDEMAILIPDGDMRFRGLDNSDSELSGEVTSLEVSSEIANVLVIEGKAQEIYEVLENQRLAARISSKYNSIDSIDKQVITKTLLVEQTVTTEEDKKESMYYLIVGTGKTTKVIKMDMGASKNE
jgi:hypothetical protein